jgi:hypothetical protein
MPTPAPSQALLTDLERTKGQFGPDAALQTAKLLHVAKRTKFSEPSDLIQFHETLLYLRAYPQSPEILRLADQLLFSFSKRLRGVDLSVFEEPEVSGIAGTAISTSYSYTFSKPLAARHGTALTIDWDSYEHPHRLAFHLAQRIPEAFEDWAIAPHADWRRRYEQAGGTVEWLLSGISAEVYDLLDLPLRWNLGNSTASRTHARIPTKKVFHHDGPLLTRRDVSLDAEFAKPPIPVTRLSKAKARGILDVIIDASAVRYRQLYGFEYPDLDHFYHAHLGRGIDIYFLDLDPKWRLPNREYCSGMYFKNGVPIGYVEVMWADGKMEVGFNLYYTFRQGETAWLYARLLKLFREQYKINEFFIDPYQLGHENDEAIESGAFWFYYKLGFRSKSKAVEQLAARELGKMAANTGYRTPPRVLRKLASARVLYKPKAT